MHLIDHFDRAAAARPASVCVKYGTQSLSFDAVRETTWQVAQTLHRQGLSRGARIAIYASNSAALYVHILGLFRLGAVWIPINPLNGAPENADVLSLVGADAVLYSGAWSEHIARIRERRGDSVRFLEVDDSFRWLDARGATQETGDEPPFGPSREPDAVVSIHCTGGTTGRPKGVPFTNLMWETMSATFFASIATTDYPVHLVAAPMSHGAGAFAMCLLAAGASQIVLPKFEPEAVLEAIEQDRITHLFLPPTAIYMLLSSPSVRKRDLRSMRCLLYAAAPMSEDRLREALEVFGPVMTQTYGQTEAPLICTVLTAGEHTEALATSPHRLRSCGRPTLLTEVAVVDADGGHVGQGTEGEVAVRGNLVLTSYIRSEGQVDRRTPDEWHRTGDIGRFDEDGYLYIVDRKKDMIISGGFNVYPSVIEQVIFSDPAVQDCAVIGVPHEKWGEAVKAIVELKPGLTVTADALRARCREELGPVRTPKTVEFWPTLPRSPAGKVLKAAIRERFWKSTDRKI